MKKMSIYEPAMCCETGLCGVGVDPELLRISTMLGGLKKQGITVNRYNLSSAPMEFINSAAVSAHLKEKGVEGLPVATLDGEIVIAGRYPSNAEFTEMLGVPEPDMNEAEPGQPGNDGGCCCRGGNCC